MRTSTSHPTVALLALAAAVLFAACVTPDDDATTDPTVTGAARASTAVPSTATEPQASEPPAAQSASEATTSIPPTRSTTVTFPSPIILPLVERTDNEIRDLLDDVVKSQPLGDPIPTLGAIAASEDVTWVPYLVDLLRMEFRPQFRTAIADALAILTGIPASTDTIEAYVDFGRWMVDRRIDPGPHYLEWKGVLYWWLSESYTPLVRLLDPPTAAVVQWGGVGIGGIPELNDPEVIAGTAAANLTPDEFVFGAVIGGQARAYPLRILDFHELANDHLGGIPVALANCTLCRSGVLFDRRVDGQTLEFVTSGLLIESNKLMLDLQTSTLWEQLTGRAIAGPLAGQQLDTLFLTTTTWADWFATHPDTDVLGIPGEDVDRRVLGSYSYEPDDAYREYYSSDRLWFPAASAEGGADKLDVLGVVVDGVALAVAVEPLVAAGPQLIEIDTASVIAVPSAGRGGRLYRLDAAGGDHIDASAVLAELADGSAHAGEAEMVTSVGTLPRIGTTPAFWFAWSAAYPESLLWAGP